MVVYFYETRAVSAMRAERTPNSDVANLVGFHLFHQ